MIINIKRKQDEKQLEEFKYDLILKNEPDVLIGYNWNIKGESPDESLEDFHLFCLSIVKDLLENNIKVHNDNNGDSEDHSYNIDDEYIDQEATLEDLNYMWSVIANNKLKRI